MSVLYIAIVVPGDIPVYELHTGPKETKKEDLNQFIVHAALDIVDQRAWTTPALYLKQVDRFNELLISCYLTTSQVKFILLHDSRCDENVIGAFFADLYDVYLKVVLNPFYDRSAPIVSASFSESLKALLDKYFKS